MLQTLLPRFECHKAGMQRLIFFGKFVSYFDDDTSRNYDTIVPPERASFVDINEDVSIAQISLETVAKRLLKITVPCEWTFDHRCHVESVELHCVSPRLGLYWSYWLPFLLADTTRGIFTIFGPPCLLQVCPLKPTKPSYTFQRRPEHRTSHITEFKNISNHIYCFKSWQIVRLCSAFWGNAICILVRAQITTKVHTNLVGGRAKCPMIIPYMEGQMSARIWYHVTWLLN